MNNPRLHRLTINFALLAIMSAFLLGLGERNGRLTIMITVGIALSYVLTDRLEVFVLPRLAAYFTMLAGAIVAIGELFMARADSLVAVASLLVYVQFGLMFQKKDRQVFEQWAAFILLELIVAALINDNVLYGLMLIPVLFMGCSTMMAYSSYASYLKSGHSGLDSNSVFARVLRWLGKEPEFKSSRGTIKMTAESQNTNQESVRGLGMHRVMALGINIIVFAVAFFYIMPRLKEGAYEGLGRTQAVVGFSGEVHLDNVKKLLETNSPALRVRFKSLPNGKDMRPIEPPYFRGAVSLIYQGEGVWESRSRGISISGPLAPPTSQVIPQLTDNADGIELIIEEQTHFEDATFGVPPFARTNTVSGPMNVIPTDWTMLDRDRGKPISSKDKQSYSIRTYAYKSGVQSRLLPDYDDCFVSNMREVSDDVKFNELELMRIFDPTRFQGLEALRDRILAKEPSTEIGPRILALEDYLVTSDEFTYTLDPPERRNSSLDPIEDFATNHKSGHCQYFASTMAMMLRSMGIPSRIVLGFRPGDFNESSMIFVVRQKHAHAWVEAYLTREQLQTTGIEIPDYITEGAWLRLDPTPAGEGSNAGGSLRSQAGRFESLEQLWQEYVMRVDSTDRSGMLTMFEGNGQGALGAVRLTFERFLAALQANQLAAGLLSPTQWFSFGGALFVIVFAISLVIFLQIFAFVSRRINWQQWRKPLSPQRLIGMKFYRRVIQALNKLHLRRQAHQTPLEFARQVEDYFKARPEQFGDTIPKVQFLTGLYYRLRFGFNVELHEAEWREIEAATQSIEQLAANRPRAIKV